MSSAAPAEVVGGRHRRGSASPRSRAHAGRRFKGGDVGSLPVIVGIVAITIFFTRRSNIFFTAVNFSNLIGQMAGVTVIAVGVVFVLLIGEIDLSVGYVSGIASVAVAEFQLSGARATTTRAWSRSGSRFASAPRSARFRGRSSRSSAFRRSWSRSRGC